MGCFSCSRLVGVFLAAGGALVWARCGAEDSAVALAQLQARLRVLVQALERQAQVGVVVSDARGTRYFEHNAEVGLVPASTTKLFWTAAALALLGDTAFLRTRIFADAPLGADGVLRGNLYVVGGGDAILTVQDLESLAEQLWRRGLRRVTGALLADGSLFDGQRWRLQYSGDHDVVQPLPPITALSFERNQVRVLVTVVRGRVTAQTVPLSPAFRVELSGVRVQGFVPRKQRRKPASWLRARCVLRGHVHHIVLQGRLIGEGSWSLLVPVERPEVAVAGTLLQRLQAVGVSVEGGFGEGICRRPVTLLAEVARPLVEVLAVINKESDNFVAEHLFKLLGTLGAGGRGQAEQARQLLGALLARWGVPCRMCQLWDGSGLSRRNRVSAAELVGLLSAVGRLPFGGLFQRSLAVSGVDGTLKHRLKAEETIERVWAKTGTLRNASALAGYVLMGENEPWVFAILSFGNVRRAKAVEDSIAATLARFSFCGRSSP